MQPPHFLIYEIHLHKKHPLQFHIQQTACLLVMDFYSIALLYIDLALCLLGKQLDRQGYQDKSHI